MGIILDVIVLIVVVLSLYLGYEKGLVNLIFSVCAVVLSIIITLLVYNVVANFIINHTEFDEAITNTILEKGVFEVDENKTDGTIEKYLAKTLNDKKNDAVKSAADIIAEKIIAIMVMIILYFIIRIILIYVNIATNQIAKLPIIKQFNELGGLVYGLIRGVLIVYAIFAVCFFIVSVNKIDVVTDFINSSYLSKFIYNNNIILNIIF